MFETVQLPLAPDVKAPDGSDVRILLQLSGGSMAHFELPPGTVSKAVVHRTVEEIWYFLAGQGEMWRKLGAKEQVVPVQPGTCVSIPVGTSFQFRALEGVSLTAVAITMPPWPGEGEAVQVAGKWPQMAA